jgi:hypothetical protein
MKNYLVMVITGLAVFGCSEGPTHNLKTDKAALERPLLQLDAQRATQLMIPDRALVYRGGAPGVFVLHNNEARFRMVRPAKKYGQQRLILSGLDGNETLVLGSLVEIHDGSPIKPVQ